MLTTLGKIYIGTCTWAAAHGALLFGYGTVKMTGLDKDVKRVVAKIKAKKIAKTIEVPAEEEDDDVDSENDSDMESIMSAQNAASAGDPVQ